MLFDANNTIVITYAPPEMNLRGRGTCTVLRGSVNEACNSLVKGLNYGTCRGQKGPRARRRQRKALSCVTVNVGARNRTSPSLLPGRCFTLDVSIQCDIYTRFQYNIHIILSISILNTIIVLLSLSEARINSFYTLYK